jgi:hypothetical protein
MHSKHRRIFLLNYAGKTDIINGTQQKNLSQDSRISTGAQVPGQYWAPGILFCFVESYPGLYYYQDSTKEFSFFNGTSYVTGRINTISISCVVRQMTASVDLA